MKTQSRIRKLGLGSRLAMGAAMGAAVLLLALAADAREGMHGAEHGRSQAARAGLHASGAHEAVWRGGAAHAMHAAWRGGGGHFAGGWHGGGRWVHGWHGGVYGWWWFNAGLWWPYYAWGYPYYPYYGYPSPYYPYPGDPPASFSNMPAPEQSWYYCDAARGYYPQVPSCPSGWRPVPAAPTPPGGTSAPPPPAAGVPPPPPPAQ